MRAVDKIVAAALSTAAGTLAALAYWAVDRMVRRGTDAAEAARISDARWRDEMRAAEIARVERDDDTRRRLTGGRK